MTAVKRDLYIEQGATFVLHFQWCQQGPVVDGVVTPGPPQDLSGWVARMQIRKNQQETALIDATSVNGKIVLGAVLGSPAAPPDPTNGRIEVRLTDDDTDMINVKTTKYDLEVEDPDGNVYRLLQGSVTTDGNITQETTDPVVGS